MRVLIVDDEAPARDKLRRMLAQHPEVQVVGEAADGCEALALAGALAPEVMFVDVQMPEVSGLDLAASLPEGGPLVVFVTAFDRYALQAFDANAVDYLLKPVEPERLARALQRLRSRVMPSQERPTHETPAQDAQTQEAPAHETQARAAPTSPERLLVTDRGRVEVVPCEQIGWLASADNYVSVHALGRSWLMRRTLAGLVADLGPRFLRIHRTVAVALAHVRSVRSLDKGDALVLLDDGTELPCSRQYRAELVQRLQA